MKKVEGCDPAMGRARHAPSLNCVPAPRACQAADQNLATSLVCGTERRQRGVQRAGRGKPGARGGASACLFGPSAARLTSFGSGEGRGLGGGGRRSASAGHCNCVLLAPIILPFRRSDTCLIRDVWMRGRACNEAHEFRGKGGEGGRGRGGSGGPAAAGPCVVACRRRAGPGRPCPVRSAGRGGQRTDVVLRCNLLVVRVCLLVRVPRTSTQRPRQARGNPARRHPGSPISAGANDPLAVLPTRGSELYRPARAGQSALGALYRALV